MIVVFCFNKNGVFSPPFQLNSWGTNRFCAHKRINAQSNIALFEQIIKAHPKGKIRVFSDNAKYNHSNILKEWLNNHPQIIFDHIPAYSPNLNPIERLWKFMKKTVINSYYYETFAAFKEKVIGFFRDINQYDDDLRTLITTNFKISV